jgi:hypothetical protein
LKSVTDLHSSKWRKSKSPRKSLRAPSLHPSQKSLFYRLRKSAGKARIVQSEHFWEGRNPQELQRWNQRRSTKRLQGNTRKVPPGESARNCNAVEGNSNELVEDWEHFIESMLASTDASQPAQRSRSFRAAKDLPLSRRVLDKIQHSLYRSCPRHYSLKSNLKQRRSLVNSLHQVVWLGIQKWDFVGLTRAGPAFYQCQSTQTFQITLNTLGQIQLEQVESQTRLIDFETIDKTE